MYHVACNSEFNEICHIIVSVYIVNIEAVEVFTVIEFVECYLCIIGVCIFITVDESVLYINIRIEDVSVVKRNYLIA